MASHLGYLKAVRLGVGVGVYGHILLVHNHDPSCIICIPPYRFGVGVGVAIRRQVRGGQE